MRLPFPKSDIPCLANRYPEPERERQLIAMRGKVREQKCLDKNILREVAIWAKLQNVKRIEDNNSENDVIRRTSNALQSESGDERVRLSELTRLYCVGPVAATAILHFFHKDPYPFLSKYSAKSVGEEERYKDSLKCWQKYVTFWQEYVTFCRDHAKSDTVEIPTFAEMRTFDRALWWYANREV